MSNFLLCTPTLSDSATLTGTQAKGDNGVANLQRQSLGRLYRTDLICEIEIDLGSAQEIDFISLVGHNGSGSITIKAGTTSAVSDYTSGSLDLITGNDVDYDKNLFSALITAQTYRYWKLEIDDTGNADGYFQAGRLYISKAFQPSFNMSYGLAHGFRDNSRTARTISQDAISVERTKLRTIDFQMDFGSKNEMFSTLYDIDRLRGTSKDVLFITDPEETTHFQREYVYGLIEETSPIINTYYNIFQKSYKIVELP